MGLRQIGSVNPNGFITAARFSYGTNSNNLNISSALTLLTNNGTNPIAVASPVMRMTLGITNYFQLTATNVDGETKTRVQAVVIPYTNATLTRLAPSSGTLAPPFGTGTTNYTLNVSNSVTNVRFTPTFAEPFAVLAVLGTNTISGVPSGPVPLNVGTNSILIYAIAQNNIETRVYRVDVVRAASQ